MSVDHFCPICRHLLASIGSPHLEKCWNCNKLFRIIEVPNGSVDEFFERVENRMRNS